MIAPSAATSKIPIPPLTSGQRRLMRAACRAAGELASLFFFGGCTVTRQQYPGSFGAGGAAQCSHRVARPHRCRRAVRRAAGRRAAAAIPVPPLPAVRGRCRRSGRSRRPRGREFWPTRTRWREIFAEIAVFPPSVSQTTASCSHPELQRQKPPRSTRTLGRPRGREFRRIRTQWREIFAEIAVFPPPSSRITASCSHPGLQRQKPPRSTRIFGPPRAPSAVRAGGSFGGSAPDGGRFPLSLRFSLLPRRRVKATGDRVGSAVLRSKASPSKHPRCERQSRPRHL